MRKLTKTLAVISLLAPASAYSLGIGGIKVHSGLNQNLNAEIALIASAGEDVSDVKVSLAPPAKFDQAKVPWSFFLSKLKFEPVVKPNGSTVIKITSNEALKEPFLDFLLEVSWPKGSLYRQFTVLLEPPTEYQKVSTAHVEEYESYEPAPPVAQPARQHYPTRTHRRAVSVDRAPANYDPSYTRKHDTLWKVAERAKKGSEPSVEQMMMAIYEANPHAFYKENVNALLPNKKLKIPKTEDVLKLSPDQALAEFKRQMQAWKNNESIPNVPQEEAAPPSEDAVTNKQLTLVAPSDAPVADDAATSLTNEPTPQTAKANTEKPKEGDANGQDGANNASANVVGSGESDKVTELETQLAAIQKSLVQKEKELQALQNAGKTVPAVEAQPPSPPENTVIEKPIIKVPELPKPPLQTPTPVKSNSQSPLVESPQTDTSYLWLAGIGAGLLSLIGWLYWRKRKFEEQFDGESMFAPSSMIKVERPSAKQPAAPKGTNVPSAIGTPEDNSFLNEFTASDFEVFDTSHVEIDPISETDVYLAYGRYQQAEELMRQAIRDQPDNDEYKLKLLEIFCATERKKEFVNYATELANTGKKDQAEFWAKVVDMGHEVWSDLALSTGENLFASERETNTENVYSHLAPLPEVEEHSLTSDEHDANPFEIATFDSDFEESLLLGADEADPFGLDNNTDEMLDLAIAEDSSVDFIDTDLQNNESIDFDLSSLKTSSTNTAASTDKIQNKESHSLLDDNGLDFDLDSVDNLSGFSLATNEVDDISEFDEFDLDIYDAISHGQPEANNSKAASLAPQTNTKPASFEVSDDFNFNMDFDLGSADETESTLHYFDESDSNFDFMDLDELGTKLDLAKAYIDMGDSEAAKEIIAEVLDKGNAEQIKTARNLFDSLAAG